MPGNIHSCQNLPLSPKGPGQILGGAPVGDGGNLESSHFLCTAWK